MRKTATAMILGLTLTAGACGSAERNSDGASINPATGSVAPGNETPQPYINRGLEYEYNEAQRTSSSPSKGGAGRVKRSKRGRKRRPSPKPQPKRDAIKGGAFSETQRTVAVRGPEIVLPSTFGAVATQLDKPLPNKRKVACLVVEGKHLRKVQTRGICKVLRNQSVSGEIVAWDALKQNHTLSSLMSRARSESVDLLVILEKKAQRSFVILDTRTSTVLAQGNRFAGLVAPGDKGLFQLHGKLRKAWTTQ